MNWKEKRKELEKLGHLTVNWSEPGKYSAHVDVLQSHGGGLRSSTPRGEGGTGPQAISDLFRQMADPKILFEKYPGSSNTEFYRWDGQKFAPQ